MKRAISCPTSTNPVSASGCAAPGLRPRAVAITRKGASAVSSAVERSHSPSALEAAS